MTDDEKYATQLRYAKELRSIFPGLGELAGIEFAGCLMHNEPMRIDEIIASVRDRHGKEPFNPEHNLYLLARYCMELPAIVCPYTPDVSVRVINEELDGL